MVAEFIPHVSRLPVLELESRPKAKPTAKPDNRHFRDDPLSGPAADMPKSTKMTPNPDIRLIDAHVEQMPFVAGRTT